MSKSLGIADDINSDFLHDQEQGEQCQKGLCGQDMNARPHDVEPDRHSFGAHNMPSPRLPLELISIICEFLSGDRALKTLASVNSSCSLFRSISMPILYETVYWDDETDWMSVLPRDHECWKHIRYAFTLTTSTFDTIARRSPTDDSQIHCPKLELFCSIKSPYEKGMIMRLSHTMKTGHFLRLIRDTPLRHWDETGGNAVRCETSSSLFLEIDSDVTLLSDIVNPNGYYTIPNDTPIVEVCLRLPIKDDTMPTYEFLLELGRIIAQSREGYFDTDHRCAKSLPMLMLVLENERQAEQLQSAFTKLLLHHPEHVNSHLRVLGPREYRLRDVYCFVRHLARAYALSYAKQPDHPAFTGRSLLAVRLFHKNLHAYLRYSPEAPTVMELEIWKERQQGTLISEVWDFAALRESDVPTPGELRWIAVEEELDDDGNALAVREVEVVSSDVDDERSDEEIQWSADDESLDSQDESSDQESTGAGSGSGG
ncbi:hypothetical protein NliqN6_4991 [Naganishia liquefaciens]|uniref:F-box domain-containing protein n=1 Tax=Naganishia liquefaciens TaxID=104408 RepID=A0A8H3TWX2_9TREE|nr:hypothetical protein NliqN6_4991 [Naganishia liquefaciens]